MEDARGRRYPSSTAVGGGICAATGVAEDGCSSSVPTRPAGGGGTVNPKVPVRRCLVLAEESAV
eukprot:3391343-Prorocentrum_lima.AAC.1